MDRQQIEQGARGLFKREIQLDERLQAALEETTSADLSEAMGDTSVDVDAALERAREVPSRTRDQELLRQAIDAVREQRGKLLRQLAEYDASAMLANVRAQRAAVAKRETRQRELLQALVDFEELAPATGGKLFAAIDPSGLLHVSKTRMQAQAVDAQEREAAAVASRDFSSGQCSGDSLDDLLKRLIDGDNLYPHAPLGWKTIAPRLEDIRAWFIHTQQAIRDGANMVGRITYKLVWRAGAIVRQDKFNVQSGFTVTLPRQTESVMLPPGLPPAGAKTRTSVVAKR